MLERKAIQTLLAWKNRENRQTVLLIEGARRVGKSTLAQEFGKKHYKSVLTIDFSTISEEFKALFLELRTDINALYQYLSTLYRVPLFVGQSLLIFDEVQCFPPARAFVKHIAADRRYDCIETGSLLSIKQNVEGILIPSEEESFRLNPLDFEEFLLAHNDRMLCKVLAEHFAEMRPLPDALHKRASRLFREYMLIGGMPRVVDIFCQGRSFQEADFEKRQILDLYRKDVGRFAFGRQAKVRAILDEIPAQLSTHEKRFKVSALTNNARMRDYEDAFFWLSDAQITNPCFAADDPSIGLSLSRSKSSVKCYMSDTGLLSTLALANRVITEENLYQSLVSGSLSLNEGMLVENIVAQTLQALGDKLFFYSQTSTQNGQQRMEIDFLTVRPFSDANNKPRIVPIEVKSSTRYTTLSLDRFAAKFKSRVGNEIVLHPGQLRKEGRRLHVPLYMAHLL